MRKSCPCKKCPDHGKDIHCHGTCDKYIEWEEEGKKEKKAEMLAKEARRAHIENRVVFNEMKRKKIKIS